MGPLAAPPPSPARGLCFAASGTLVCLPHPQPLDAGTHPETRGERKERWDSQPQVQLKEVTCVVA